MPSIFIWKSDKECISSDNITYYMGSNWVLESTNSNQKSYRIIEQSNIEKNNLNQHVLAMDITIMPNNWVGSELLEVIQIPYKIIKMDDYGILEHIGEWNRFTSNNDINFKNNNLEFEFKKILNWINTINHNMPYYNNINRNNIRKYNNKDISVNNKIIN